MKLLLDENLPVRLKYRFGKEIEVAMVNENGWNAIKNGELLQLMVSHGFDILITADRNLCYQQNLQKYGIVVILLISNDNRYHTLKEYIPLIEKELPPKVEFGVIEIALK
jgi:predicted nuclease of predicted toxin-antitoxin system